MGKINLIKQALQTCLEQIDAGNSHLTEDEEIELLMTLQQMLNTNVKLSKYQACNFLRVSRATFDNYVKCGKLPKGMKQQGFKELFWLKTDLIKFKENERNA